MTRPTPETDDDARAAARASTRRHAAILLAIILVGVLWLALASWLGLH
jgi:hypothetical protein